VRKWDVAMFVNNSALKPRVLSIDNIPRTRVTIDTYSPLLCVITLYILLVKITDYTCKFRHMITAEEKLWDV